MISPKDLALASDIAWPLWDDQPIEGAFQLNPSSTSIENAVVSSVSRPWLFGYHPKTSPNGRAILILGGGGYVELMVGREGHAVALWLTRLGYHAYVLVHRFPTAETGSSAPLDDAQRALIIIEESGNAKAGLGLCGLSSGGHLAATLLAKYPDQWTARSPASTVPTLDFAIIGYGPISTNAVGRTIIENKAALAPPEKQELYNILQPDVQLRDEVPPTFIVYSANDPVVPVVNASRLAQAMMEKAGKVELHVFADAPHGFALDTKDLPVAQWPVMCEAWMRQRGFC